MSRLSTNYDRIITSAPLDRQAAVIGAADGEGGEQELAPTKAAGRVQWDAPPPCEPLPSGVVDLSGMVVGRLKVLRFLGRGSGSGADANRWLVRCSCGAYESRRNKPILQPQVEDMCGRCHVSLKSAERLRAAITGRWDDGRPAAVEPGLKTASGDVRRLKEGASA